MASSKKSSSSSSASSSSSNGGGRLKLTSLTLFLLIAIPFFIGFAFSNQNLALVQTLLQPLLGSSTAKSDDDDTSTSIQNNNDSSSPAVSGEKQGKDERSLSSPSITAADDDETSCYESLLALLSLENDDPESSMLNNNNFDVVVHHNGEAEPCGRSTISLLQGMQELLEQEYDNEDDESSSCPVWTNKYHVESFLTRVLYRILEQGQCADEDDDPNDDYGFYGYCDRGAERTPILLDHDDLIPIPHQHFDGNDSLPCHFHSPVGVRITSLSLLLEQVAAQQQKGSCAATDGDGAEEESCAAQDAETNKELHLYAVPAGRVFMFAPSHIGQVISLPHITGGDPDVPVELHVLSVQPRIFDITNFFTRDESNDIVQRALTEQRDSHRIKRSSTGATGYNINQQRTSESGFDTDGETAMALKRRGMQLLGFDEYLEGHTDGLQVLRYNLTTAYIPHMDWIEGNLDKVNNYESGEVGGNRYATILLYMSDLGEKDGGETVFVEAWPIGQDEKDRVPMSTAIREARESGDTALLKQGSWEETMVAQCRTRLAVRPNSAKAILFYSQTPLGLEDKSSRHGACPVLKGDKWAANLWVWNTPRPGFRGNPRKPKYEDLDDGEAAGFKLVVATFRNPGTNPEHEEAELFFQNDFWEKFGRYDPVVRVNTYKGHQWNARVNGKVVQTWTITDDSEAEQTFILGG